LEWARVWEGPGQGVGGSWLAAKFLIFFFIVLYKNMKNPKNLKKDYISAARRVNPPRPDIYFSTLFCSKLVKLMLKVCPLGLHIKDHQPKDNTLQNAYMAILFVSFGTKNFFSG
jgi:hypothetical protein